MTSLILAADPLLSGEIGLDQLIVVLIKVLVAFAGLLVSVILMVWFERKLIADMQKRMEEMNRKLEQGSQQLQGEVLELDLEAALKAAFPRDHIEPVAKGVFGGDVLHHGRGGQCVPEIGSV